MVHPSVFIQNPLIDKIADDENWTVSDDKKKPVNAKVLLATEQVVNAKFDGEWPLVSLRLLDSNIKLDAVNRAYWLQARKNRVIAIDIEPVASDLMKNYMIHFPAHYTEMSRNGGVHVILEVPESMINDENRYLFDDLSVLKEDVPKNEEGKELRPAHFEVLFNDHYVTFTKFMVHKPYCDYENDSKARSALAEFLDTIVKMDKKRKEIRERIRQYKISMINNQITTEKKEAIEKFTGLLPFDNAKEQAEMKDPADFGGDLSRYEMSIASGLAYHTLRCHEGAKDTISYRELAESLTENDLVYAIYTMLEEVVPYRDKHDEERDGLPWLLFTAKNAYEFTRANTVKKKKRKKG